MNLHQIESAIAALPKQELAQLTRWLGDYVAAQIDQDAWDRQIEADSASGKLDAFYDDALASTHLPTTKDL
ncbi:MAG: hypothetical protein SFW63_03005 [Alphaproteobacteria bacterium]|nr:hypothetical protein [Alphaproteobacteria bacterium]